ncbi:MAG: HAD family hydrolase [Magnetococcales bacterium]|nr:HAD family hydrolase [Magnetococcales bacterium]
MQQNKKLAIVFDCDGVLIESTKIKTQAFAKLFSGYPDIIPQILAYHEKYVGISRFAKFRYIYKDLLNKPLSAKMEKQLGDEFSQTVLEQVIAAPLVAGVVEFLEKYQENTLYFVASGTPQAELDLILEKKKLSRFFLEQYGSPTSKPDAIDSIMSRYNLVSNRVIMVGDGESDQQAADATGIKFIPRLTDENHKAFSEKPWSIDNLTFLAKAISGITGQNI